MVLQNCKPCNANRCCLQRRYCIYYGLMFRVNGRTLATGGNNQYKQQQKPATWFAPKGYMVKYGYFLLEVVYYPFLFLE